MLLKGNCLVAQSGGPTAVINSAVCGVIHEAMEQDQIEGIYGGVNGILGVLNEEIMDFAKETKADIDGLLYTPSAAVGSCRYKLGDINSSREEYERILEVFKAHNIRYFFYSGGNDSMDTADKIARLAKEIDYELRVMGVAKTIDNDLAETDHCPGYGSVVKFNAVSVMEAGLDTEALYTTDTATIIEVMGRNAGWIAGGTAVAAREQGQAPHLIYMPEAAFTVENFIEDCNEVLSRYGRLSIVVGEGLKDAQGNYVSVQAGDFAKDSFGHQQLGGIAEALKSVVETRVGVKCRYAKLATCQRNAMHFASKTDRDEAYMCGREAARQAANGTSGYMVGLKRVTNDPYKSETVLAELAQVANGEKFVPRNWINERGNFPTREFIDYVKPLIEGEVEVPIVDGLPQYTRFKKVLIDKKCPHKKYG